MDLFFLGALLYVCLIFFIQVTAIFPFNHNLLRLLSPLFRIDFTSWYYVVRVRTRIELLIVCVVCLSVFAVTLKKWFLFGEKLLVYNTIYCYCFFTTEYALPLCINQYNYCFTPTKNMKHCCPIPPFSLFLRICLKDNNASLF